MDDMDMSSQDQDGQGNDVMDSLGVQQEQSEAQDEPHEEPKDSSQGAHSKETLAVQKRLKAQRRAHEREVRDLHARIGDLESRMTQPNLQHDQKANPYSGQPGDEAIHKAVGYALQQRDMAERQAKQQHDKALLAREYQDFQKHLDHVGDKYDDFHDVVYGNDTPYTPAMRDYALTLPRSGSGSAGEVLYKLGKNPEELQRIAELPPYKQAAELAKLSHALVSGGDSKNQSSRQPLGNIKSNPVTNSGAVTDKTPIGSIRERMKSGSWK